MTIYNITEAEHQFLTDFLGAIVKGKMKKSRMAEIAGAVLQDVKIWELADESQVAPEPEPLDNLPAGELVIGFEEFDGTQRIIAWHQADEEQPAGYRPDTSHPDPFQVLVERYNALGETLADERTTAGTLYDIRMNGIISELQGITGVKAPIHVVLNRLRETQECVDALMELPAKTGTVRALRRVLALRYDLQVSIQYTQESADFLAALSVGQVLTNQDVAHAEDLEDQGQTVLSIINESASPPAEPDPEPNP